MDKRKLQTKEDFQDLNERKQGESQIHKLNRIYAVLSTINQAIVRIHDTKGLLDEVCRIAIEYGKFQMAWVGMIDSQSNHVAVAASSGFSGDYLDKIEIDLRDVSLSSGPTGIAIKTGNHKVSNNIEMDDSMVLWRNDAIKQGYKSSASFPLIVFNKIIGAFSIYSDELDFFQEDDINLLDEIANDISFAMEFIENETLRKHAEEALKQSEARLNEAQHIAHIGSWELDLDKNSLTWSDEIFRIFEIDPTLFGASYEAFLDAIHPDDRDAVNDAYTNSLKTRIPYAINHRLLFADGRIKYIHEQCETFYDVDGKPFRSIGIVQDITEQKQTERKIQKLNQELEKRVLDRTVQLEAANKELEAFAYSVSHDLRAPLRGIDGFSQVLLEDYQDKIDEKGENYLHRIRLGAQRMAQLIDDMLNLSRVNRGELNIRQVDLSVLVETTAEELRQTQPNRNVEFIIQKGVQTKGDDRLLRIVFDNLLGNAWKFTSNHPNACIEFGLLPEKETTVYFVRDDGAGFDMKYSDKLFGAFQRLHNTTEFPGTGVGLATVQRIIHRHGGEVWAESEIENGATFYFTIPLK